MNYKTLGNGLKVVAAAGFLSPVYTDLELNAYVAICAASGALLAAGMDFVKKDKDRELEQILVNNS
ncbi:MAG: hypothetical protein CMH64_03755 [Nanoarchaeota archaeon]|nr:hypothetical protein [Nanoarchaeota archaeon]|tara:strand:+ start:1800 stop:1997 length:198 start_codon:yes stop_codon:yes gene_type:complete